jgi:para-nitrobenzyl esterase
MVRRDLLKLTTGIAALAALPRNVFAALPIPTPIVKTTYGAVQGLTTDGVHAYKGVRYGAAPVGELRFKPPRAPEPWQGTADAIGFGAPAVQMNMTPPSGTDLSRQLSTIFTMPADAKIDNEDCLFLNVWTPGVADDKKRAVMFWIHGGGYAYGSGSWPIYDGANLARRGDVVVVTVNHRLNLFGYLYLAELGGADYAQSGNAGMLDLVQALQWVRDNIAAFGGDPGNVTVFGESGGGMKVSTLLAMPSAKGFFHKAIVQSGPGLSGATKEQATATTRSILAELGVDAANLSALTTLPADKLIGAAFAAAAKAAPGPGAFQRLSPVVDGVVLPSDPFIPAAPAQAAEIPLLIGTNKDEMTLFDARELGFLMLDENAIAQRAKMVAGDKADALITAYRKRSPTYTPAYLLSALNTGGFMWNGSIQLAERKAAQKAPVYMYRLDWETPVANGLFKAPHTLEIPLVFQNVEYARVLVGDGAQAQQLADVMSDAWLAFAKSGNPGTNALPKWPAYDKKKRATMIFDAESKVVNDPDAEIREIYAS